MVRLNVVRQIMNNRLALMEIDEKEADYILSYTLNIPVTELSFKEMVTDKEYKQIISNLKKRCKHKPISKIFKKAYFYGLEFLVTKDVLSPRFDTELLVEKACEFIKPNDRVLDLCTGSGCIAVSLAKNNNAYVEACDISKKALKVAKKNIQHNNVQVECYLSNMFERLQGKFNVIVTNPPYIETDTISTLDIEVKNYDPIIALDGGEDGLKFYREIADKAKSYLLDDGVLIMEIGYNQAESIKQVFKDYKLEIFNDYNNLPRVVVARV